MKFIFFFTIFLSSQLYILDHIWYCLPGSLQSCVCFLSGHAAQFVVSQFPSQGIKPKSQQKCQILYYFSREPPDSVFIYFIGCAGLRCCGLSWVAGRCYDLVVLHRLLVEVTSLAAEHGLWASTVKLSCPQQEESS